MVLGEVDGFDHLSSSAAVRTCLHTLLFNSTMISSNTSLHRPWKKLPTAAEPCFDLLTQNTQICTSCWPLFLLVPRDYAGSHSQLHWLGTGDHHRNMIAKYSSLLISKRFIKTCLGRRKVMRPTEPIPQRHDYQPCSWFDKEAHPWQTLILKVLEPTLGPRQGWQMVAVGDETQHDVS